MDLRDTLRRHLASQLGRPRGPIGALVTRRLNRANARSMRACVDALQARPGQQVADLGFGGGLALPLLAERVAPGGRVTGVEISDTAIAQARRLLAGHPSGADCRLVRGSLTDLPLPDGTLNGFITVNTLYFVADLDRALAEMARVLAPGGRAVLGIGDPDAMAAAALSRDFQLRPVADVEAAATRHGLRPTSHDRLGDAPDAYHVLVLERIG